jgi:hypothetical protein
LKLENNLVYLHCKLILMKKNDMLFGCGCGKPRPSTSPSTPPTRPIKPLKP